jgi:hypothetical protein
MSMYSNTKVSCSMQKQESVKLDRLKYEVDEAEKQGGTE